MCLWICLCVCECMYLCVSVCVCMSVYVCVCVFEWVCVCMYVYLHMNTVSVEDRRIHQIDLMQFERKLNIKSLNIEVLPYLMNVDFWEKEALKYYTDFLVISVHQGQCHKYEMLYRMLFRLGTNNMCDEKVSGQVHRVRMTWNLSIYI